MATITAIKERILQLDSGDFQVLCDDYLSRKGYPNITSLGTQAGTAKTTKGTPDTYFKLDNGKYIFAEYTTQQTNLYKKIEEDIDKCFAASIGIPISDISEIVYCYTSSNLSVKEDKCLQKKCEDKNVKLTLIGIDQMADDIYRKYPTLAVDHLNLPLNTGKILEIDDFIKLYDKNPISAPLNTKFQFRMREIEQIDDAFTKSDVVLLSGAAGVGKTRLALEYARRNAQKNIEKVYCINGRSLSLETDLIFCLEKPGKYFIVIDDGNQLSLLTNAVEYVNKKDEGYDIKFLITVRNYALKKIEDEIKEITPYHTIKIKPFTDEEIKELVLQQLEISNTHYLDRIVKIAEGNARIAMMAGKVARQYRNLDSIRDASGLYDIYYSKVVNCSHLNEDKDLQAAIGIISFLHIIDLDCLDKIEIVLEEKHISKETFINKINDLHNLEIVNIYYNKAVVFEDQCFENYILKFIFYDIKSLSLMRMIEIYFQSNFKRTKHSIETILYIFNTKGINEFVLSEVLSLWNKLEAQSSPIFDDFVRKFYTFNPVSTLSLIQDKINRENTVDLLIDKKLLDTDKMSHNVNNDILFILGGFADSENIEAAIELFFVYYLKRPDIYKEFYNISISFFGFNRNSAHNDFLTQKTYINQIIKYSDQWKNSNITTLFLNVASEWLQLQYDLHEFDERTDSFNFGRIHCCSLPAMLKLRDCIWEQIMIIACQSKYMYLIKALLESYGRKGLDDANHGIVVNDSQWIYRLIFSLFKEDSLEDSLLCKHIDQIFQIAGCSSDRLVPYLKSEKMNLYNLLNGPEYSPLDTTEIKDQNREAKIDIYWKSKKNNQFAFFEFWKIYEEIQQMKDHFLFEVYESMNYIIKKMMEYDSDFVYASNIIKKSSLIGGIDIGLIVRHLFENCTDREVYEWILDTNPKIKKYWEYIFYKELPEKYISNDWIMQLLEFLDCDSKENGYGDRRIDFLKKYDAFDSSITQKATKIIFSNKEECPSKVNWYLYPLFNAHNYLPHLVVELFNQDLDLLEKVYIFMEYQNKHIDIDAGVLFEICKKDPEFIKVHFHDFIKEGNLIEGYSKKYTIAFEMSNYIKYVDMVIDDNIRTYKYCTSLLEIYVKQINSKIYKEKCNEWICHYISKNATDSLKMRCLFEAISKLSKEQKMRYTELFLKNNKSYESFCELPIISTCCSFAGADDGISLYLRWIEYLKTLLDKLHGIDFIKHKQYIEDLISDVNNRIQSVQIQKALNE